MLRGRESGNGQLYHGGRLRYGARGLGGRGSAGRVAAGCSHRDRGLDPSDQGFALSWDPANGATSYEVTVGGVLGR